MNTARYVEVALIYEGVDISRDIAPFLISFTYNDNASDKADDIDLTLEDRNRLWVNDWFPMKGDKIVATIIVHDWHKENDVQTLPCGAFEVDSVDCSGPPNVINLKGISTLISKPMKSETHTKAWENVRLSTIAGDVATRNGLEFFWDCRSDFYFERKDQVEVSDLEFLRGLAHDYGVNVKVTDTKLVCYERELYEQKNAVDTLEFGDEKILRWRFSSKATGIYKAARRQYHDAVKNVSINTLVNADDVIKGANRTLIINEKADSIADAQKKCKERLQAANSKEVTGEISLMGDLRYVGGSTVEIKGFGAFDGKYLIESAVHSIGNGYTTSIKLSMNKETKKEKVSAATKRKAAKTKKSKAATPLPEVKNVYEGERVKVIK